MSSPLQRENVTTDSKSQQVSTAQTTPTTRPRKIESTSLSPEDWLEQFYNGKNLLRSKQREKIMKRDKGKFDNFPRVQGNIDIQEKNIDKINLFLKPLIVFSKDEILTEQTDTEDLRITTGSPAKTTTKSVAFISTASNSRRKIKFGTKLSNIDFRQPNLIANAKSIVKINKNIPNKLDFVVDKLKGMVLEQTFIFKANYEYFTENNSKGDNETFSPGGLAIESDDDDSSLGPAGGESNNANVNVNDSEVPGGGQGDRWGDTMVFSLDNAATGWFITCVTFVTSSETHIYQPLRLICSSSLVMMMEE